MRCWLFLPILLLPGYALAQTDDRTYLTAFLEDNLSGIGRQVTITGFSGALTSQAAIETLTIADADGVWLTLTGVVLDWNRAALFSGEVSVNALTAQEIRVARVPGSGSGEGALPSPEAAAFSLPELPVSINIGRIAADRIMLEDAVLGQSVEGTFEASMALLGGEGQADLTLDRTDAGPEGNIHLAASYSNANRQLVLDLDATEAAGGIAATLLGLPGAPAVSLTVKGAGPVDDFVAEIGLTTDDISRLAGKVEVIGADDGSTQFKAALGGDMAPLFLPDYAAFFGPDVGLTAAGNRGADGRLVLSDLTLQTRAMAVNGTLSLAADGQPEKFGLNVVLAAPDGSAVLLPLANADQTRLTRANLDLTFDAANGDDWTIQGAIEGVDQPDLKIARLSLDGSGKILSGPSGTLFDFATRFGAEGLAPADPALGRALGPNLAGTANGAWQEGSGNVRLSSITLAGDGVSLSASGTIGGLSSGIRVTGEATALIADLARLSGIAGRPLAGMATTTLAGSGTILGGVLDLTAQIDGTDLGIDQAEVDALLSGQSRIEASVARTETGTLLRQLDISAATLKAAISGKIASAGSDLAASLTFSDLSAMGAGYRGGLTATASLKGTTQSGLIVLDGQATDLAIGQSDADKLLRGTSTLSAKVTLKDQTARVADIRLRNPQIALEARAAEGSDTETELSAKLANLGLLLPEFPGPVSLSGTADTTAGAIRLNLRAKGPGQIDMSVNGQLVKDGSADLAIKGTGQAALANAFIDPRTVSGGVNFDMRLKGPLKLSSLTGRAGLSGGRISDPDLPFSLQGVGLTADLSDGQAQISGQAAVSTGGAATISGSFGLAAPNPANLSLSLAGIVLRDPVLYETRATGSLTVTGPLAGGAFIAGQMTLRDTELQIPSGGLAGVEAIPDLRHLREPVAVRATRARAGNLGIGSVENGQGSDRIYGLDLTILAPNRVFLRGRGLDAELGGQLRLGGTTANVIPEGGLTLIRGRLEILGKRLDLSEAQLRLEGDFVPYVRVAASTQSDGVTSSVLIEGQADDPAVSFTSSPELPQEEVLSRLLFGRGLETLSVFQAAQLASAVANLAGKGGDGIVAKLRKGFGLDDLDVRTTDDGTTALRAGKYIARNVYSEIEVDQTGKSQIQLNLDVSANITLRGRVGSDGNTGIGIVLEKDY